MNLQDLLTKLKSIEEGQNPIMAPTKDDQPMGAGAGDESVEECLPMVMPGAHEGEQDHVGMNVTLSGNGAGGVRDLMNIIRQIDQEPTAEPQHHHHDHEQDVLFGDSYENSVKGDPGSINYQMDFPSGDDMNSKAKKAPHFRGLGNNALRETNEELVNKLQAMYETIKEGKDLDKVRDKYDKYDESAKWRDPKYKDKLYTQEPDDEDDYGSDDFYGDPRPENDPGKKHRMGGVGHQYDSNDKLKSYYGGDHGNTTGGEWRGKTSHSPYKDSGVSVKGPRKGLLTKSAIRNVKDRIHSALGQHPEPSLPETSINESNDIIKLSKMLNG